MSYDLSFQFERPIKQQRFLQYFATRKNFTVSDTAIDYLNSETEVYFSIRYRLSGVPFFRTISSAEFEINYFRPSFFGLEAEIELSALVAEFSPKIEDGQINGMGEGPYSREGFLNGWNFGNEFSVYSILSNAPDYKPCTMPASKLRTAWDWNYRHAEWRAKLHDWPFVPHIMVCEVEGIPSLCAIWPPIGRPILLPKVDYVLVGRKLSGDDQYGYGLATWAEVIDVVRRAGFDTGSEPLDLRYFRTPDPIVTFFGEIQLFEQGAAPRLELDKIIDTEVVEAAMSEGRFLVR